MAKIFLENIGKLEKNQSIVGVYIDTEEESINAFEARIELKKLIFRDYLEKDSIVSFWIEKPKIENGILIFSGVIPGGYIGRKGVIINLILEGEGEIKVLPSSKILLNDGLGTKASLKTFSLTINQLDKNEVIKIIDNYPPEPFLIYLNKDKNIHNGKYYITFEAKDKQSGIAYYEIAEYQSFLKPNIEKLQFEKISPPYVLKDQTLRSYIFVKAVDRFGNERIEYLKPKIYLTFDEILYIIIFITMFMLFKKFLIKLKK